jgi:hypothetical protein
MKYSIWFKNVETKVRKLYATVTAAKLDSSVMECLRHNPGCIVTITLADEE